MNTYFKQSILISISLLSFACSNGGGNSNPNNYAQCTTGVSLQADDQSEVQALAMDTELMSQDTNQWIVGLDKPMLQPSGNYINKYKVVNRTYSIESLDPKLLSIKFKDNADKEETLRQIMDSYPVKYIEPDHKLHTLDIDSANFNNRNHWGHNTIHTSEAWLLSKGNNQITVAVIDSGVDFDHPDLQASRWTNTSEVANGKDDDGNGYIDDLHGWNFVEDNNKPYPHHNVKNDYHGTHVAGIIASKKTNSAAGVAPNVKLMSLRFLNENKSGYTSDAVKSVYYAVDNGAKVINASFGSYKSSRAMLDAIKYAQSKGVLIVAAAGNLGQDNDERPFYPASYPATNIIAVTASTSSDRWLSGINYGDKSVDIAAPGSSIYSTDQNDGYRSRSGSSMAAPFVTGVAALALSINKHLSGEQLKTIVLDSAYRAPQLSSKAYLGRRLDAGNSAQKAYSSSHGDIVPPSCDL